MKSPDKHADSPAEMLWQVILARDRTLVETKRNYERRIEELAEALKSTEAYWAKSLDGTKAYLKGVEADRALQLVALKEMQDLMDKRGAELHSTQARLRELEQTLQGTKDYLETVEQDRDDRLKSIEFYQLKIKETQADLERNENYLKTVEQDRDDRLKSIEFYQLKIKETQADLERNTSLLIQHQQKEPGLLKSLQEKDRRLAELDRLLSRRQTEIDEARRHETEKTRCAFSTYARHLRKVIVPLYHERLLPQIIQLSVAGANVEVFGSPPELSGNYLGALRFSTESLWSWLGVLDSLFNEKAYLETHPDVAAAVAHGDFISALHHFHIFGQFEGRSAGTRYFAGLAEFEALLFDRSDSERVVRCIAGRLQRHHCLFISGCDRTENWLPPGANPGWVGGLQVLHRPPPAWLALPAPTTSRAPKGNWPRLRLQDIFPTLTPDGREWPKISVVTVSFNQADYLEETLRSVLDQKYPNLEYIVVDGGSTDGSVEIIKRHAADLAWWISEKDDGQSHALNKAFARATGRILTWLNSDDRLAPGGLFRIAETFLRNPVDLVVGRCARVMDKAALPYHFHRCNLPLGEVVRLPLESLLNLDGCWLKGHFFHQPEVFFTKEIFERSGGRLDEDLFYSMDYDLWVRMAKAGATVLAIPEIVALFRQHERQKTGGNDLPFLPELRQVNQAHRAALQVAGG